MKKNSRLRLLGAVVAALPVLGLTGAALGQYRVDDSHVNDANNRIGSGGYNSSSNLSQRDLAVTGNQIVSGNVTGLNYFHGSATASQDPNFLGAADISPSLDRFNAISAPVNYGQRSTGAPTAQVYYNRDTLNTAPPPTLAGTVGSSTLSPVAPQTNNLYDARLGYNGIQGAINTPADQSFQLTPGELDLPGPTDTSGNATTLTASPLYGIRDWRADDSSDAYFLSQYSNMRLASAATRDRMSNAAIQQMRNELNNTVVLGPNGQPVDNSQTSGNNGNPNNLALAGTIGAPAGAPYNGSLTPSAMNSNLDGQPINGSINTNQGTTSRVMSLPNPNQQSSQIADLETRQKLMAQRQKLLSNAKGKLSPAEAAAQFNAEQKYVADYNKAAGTTAGTGAPTLPGTGASVPGTMGGATTMPTGTARITPTGTANMGAKSYPSAPAPSSPPLKPMLTEPLQHDVDDQPYVITSLANGIKAKGLADLMKKAETQMRDGHFNGALDSYDAAEQVAPNNPFIAMGRGFAELGASYYGKAELDLRRSIDAEPALLAGKYDLKGFVGEDRLKFVVSDLTEIYQSEKGSVRPALLLGFIAHNQGDNAAAANYLSAADQRAGGRDPIVKLMREEWGFAPAK
jgi:hypothetical protein